MAESLINAGIGPYILRELVGSGGVSEVFRAQHGESARDYAVKVMRAERAAEPGHLRQFQDEYGLLERLRHPGVPRAYRFGEIRGRPCMVIDFVPGKALHLLVAAGVVDPMRAWGAIVDVTAYLHGQEIVHNDLKLENGILRPDGRVVLVDFGSARQQITRTFLARLLRRKEAVFGSPTYIAPELLTGKGSPSYASDCYALGVCAFMLFTGEPPFGDPTKSGRLRATVRATAPSIMTRVKMLEPMIGKMIDACLAKDPENRPQHAGEILRVLLGSGAHVKLDDGDEDETRRVAKS